jgi:DDE superfamily endonuclease/Tc5 transposase DNA-binding domain
MKITPKKATLLFTLLFLICSLSMPPKSKVTLTDGQKHEFCLYACNNKKTREEYVKWIEQKWQVTVSESTITRILQSKEKRLATEVTNYETKRHKSVSFPQLELALKEFVLVYQERTILSDAILIEKAGLLAKDLDIPEGALQFSSGWLYRFKNRHGIRQKQLHGEAASADQSAIANSLPLLRDKCSRYSLDRIYNMDETGLFYRLAPDRTLATRQLSGHKKNKERLSVALCANADGSHKLNPLIIGKSAKPRCFKNVRIKNLAMTYRNNTKAWMLTTTFQEWLHEFDRQVTQKHGNQRVLLLLDNCPSHKMAGLNLQHVDVHFFPPNTTSKIQPMDAGIIMTFKKHYRSFHLR